MENIAQKLVEALLDLQVQKWGEKLDGIAQQIGVDPNELKKFLKPLIQNTLDKHFSN